MMNEMTLAEWLRNNNCEASEEAEAIRIGQTLTEEVAMRIKQLLKRAYLDRENLSILADRVEFLYPSNVPFLTQLSNLVDAGVECGTNWSETLYHTMTDHEYISLGKMSIQQKYIPFA